MSEETKALTVPVADIRMMAEAVAKSKLFGMKTTDEAMALMLIAHAEGLHPAIAARDYHIIQGRPSKSAEAMLRSFLSLGGRVEWHDLTDEKASATFSHSQGGSVRIDWDMARAKKAGLTEKNGSMFLKYPRQMLRARVISEGVRTVHPGATSGMYTPEEVQEFKPKKGKAAPEQVDVVDAEPLKQEPEKITKAQQQELFRRARLRVAEPGLKEAAIGFESPVKDVCLSLKLSGTADILAADYERVLQMIEKWEPGIAFGEEEPGADG